MSCYGCGQSYSFFLREHGCKKCGFSFCSKCLNHSSPESKNEKICSKCFKKLTSPDTQSVPNWTPPRNYLDRVAKSEDYKPKPVFNSDHGGGKGARAKEDVHGISDIQNRLHNLKQSKTDSQPVSAEKDVEDRLAKLRGHDIAAQKKQHASQQNFSRPQPKLTEEEQTKNLLEQAFAEAAIDGRFEGGKIDPALDVGNRLAKLRGEDSYQPPRQWAPGSAAYSETSELPNDVEGMLAAMQKETEADAHRAAADLDKDKEIAEYMRKIQDRKGGVTESKEEDSDEDEDELSEEERVKKLLEQIAKEQALEEKLAKSGGIGLPLPPSGVPLPKNPPAYGSWNTQEDEVQWCCICNADAVLKCSGCDYDLYCQRCYKEGHDKHDYEYHRPKYLSKK